MIKRVGIKKYVVMSKDGKKKLSKKPMSNSAAKSNLQQIQASGDY